MHVDGQSNPAIPTRMKAKATEAVLAFPVGYVSCMVMQRPPEEEEGEDSEGIHTPGWKPSGCPTAKRFGRAAKIT